MLIVAIAADFWNIICFVTVSGAFFAVSDLFSLKRIKRRVIEPVMLLGIINACQPVLI
ncbi:hypothetical protein AAFN90_14475 [Erwiniaceae bacterium CAU 1747]